MTFLVFLVFAIFLSLLQTTVYPLNFLAGLAVYLGLNDKNFLLKTFLLGLVLDLAGSFRLGISSLAFIFVGFLIHLYMGKFSRFHFLFVLFMFFFTLLAYNFLTQRQIFTDSDWCLVLLFMLFYGIKELRQKKELEIKLRE